MLNVFLSMRTKGLNFMEALSKRECIMSDFLRQYDRYKDDIVFIDSLNEDYVEGESNPIEFLGKSIITMKDADIALIPVDYKKSHGCKCEYTVAVEYDIPIRSYIYSKNGTWFFDGFLECIERGDDNAN